MKGFLLLREDEVPRRGPVCGHGEVLGRGQVSADGCVTGSQ